MSSKAETARSADRLPPQLTRWSSLPVRQHGLSQGMQNGPAGAKDPTAVRGKGKSKAMAKPNSGPDDSGDNDDGHRNAHAANGSMNGYQEKGKVKGKAPVVHGFVDPEENDLYP